MIVRPRTSTATIRKMGSRGELRKLYDGTEPAPARSDQTLNPTWQIASHANGPERIDTIPNLADFLVRATVYRQEGSASPRPLHVLIQIDRFGPEDAGKL